jgi:uncharacterized protein
MSMTQSQAADLVAAATAGDAERVRVLLTDHPELADARKDGQSLVLLARYRNDTATVDALREAGHPLDVFEAAALDDSRRLSALLRDDPALARAWTADGFTALHLAAFFGSPAVAVALLDAGADVDAVSQNEMHVAPIHSAVAGRREVALLLVSRGAQVNVRQRHGWTPLHAAAQHGDDELVEALLQAGADASLANDDGVTAADLAERAGYAAVVQALRAGVMKDPPARAAAQPQ